MSTLELEEIAQRHFVTLFPFQLTGAEQILDFDKIEISPGIFIEKCDYKNIGEFNYFWQSCPHSKFILPNVLITVHGKKYKNFIFKYLRNKNINFEKYLSGAGTAKNFFEIYNSIHRHIIISIYLIKKMQCYFVDDVISIEIDKHGNPSNGNFAGYSKLIDLPLWAFHKKERKEPEKITEIKLKNMFKNFHLYFNPLCWMLDRISSALGYFWDYIITNDQPNLGFLSLVTCIEALVTTGNRGEITHQICERVSVLLSNKVEDRIKMYNNLKKIYSLRSKLIHGSSRISKGKESWIISAKSSKTYVAMEEFAELVDICVKLFNVLLSDKDFLSCIGSNKEDALLDQFFISKLFS